MKTKTLTSLFAIALALVACNKKETEPAFTPELKLDKTEKISAPAAGGNVNLKVTANVSWTVTTSNESVATVSPASKEITDKKSVETAVTVTISANEATEARTATLTLKAEGCKDIVVEIEQAAAEISTVFEVLDNQGSPVATTYDVASAGGTVALVYVHSNINWTATASDAWLSADPASYTAKTGAEYIAVTLAATANTDAARSATITFSAEGQQDVVITVNQALAPKLEITISDITYQNATATYTPSDNELYYIEQYYPKAEYTFASDDEFARALLDYFYQKYGTTYSEYGYTSYAELFFDGLAVKGKDEISMTELDPETEYLVFGFFVDKNMEVASSVTREEFKTEVKPSADPAYLANLGTYKFNCYDYFEDDAPVQNAVMELTEGVVNQSYKLCIYEIFGPDYTKDVGPEYIDRFDCVWNKTNNTIELANGTLGDFGRHWGFQFTDESCGIYVSMGFNVAEVRLEKLVLSPDKSGNLIGSTIPELNDGDSIFIQAGIYTVDPQTGKLVETDKATACLDFFDGVTFNKAAAPAVKNSVKHSLYEMPNYFKPKKINGEKAVKIGKLSIR